MGTPIEANRAILSPEMVRAAIRLDLATFIGRTFRTLNPERVYLHNWHIDALAWHLERVRRGEITRLIVTMPPRSLKSISSSVAFPAYVHGHDPAASIVCASYGQELATKLSNDYRAILQSRWYRELFPRTRVGGWKDAEHEVLLTARGGRLATSIGGSLTGRGADIVVIDDPIKPVDALSETKRAAVNEWFGSTLLSRLNEKKTGAIIIVTQRVHADDLVGHLLALSGSVWTHLDLPAIAPAATRVPVAAGLSYARAADEVLHEEREPRHVLDTIRQELGAEAFAAQYLQCPVPPGGNLFKRQWLRRYDAIPVKGPHDRIMQSWDTASKTASHNDWSVGTTWLLQDGLYHLLDVIRGRFEFPELRAAALSVARAYAADGVLVEEAGVGTGLIAELRHAGVAAIGGRPTLEKVARASIETIKFEAGLVRLPKAAAWLTEFESELLAFPGGRHDDQVDSMTQMLAYKAPPPLTIRMMSW